MTGLDIRKEISVDQDRDSFTFVGLAEDCTSVSVVGDANGWNVIRSGVTKQSAWITLTKSEGEAASFPTLIREITQSDAVGRVVLEV